MANCSCTTNCNTCGPSEEAISQLANKAAAYARQANTYAVNAENTFTNFNALYLGAKNANPTVDNQGDPLIVGALYFNTVSNQMRVWTGSTWIAL